MAVDTHAAAPPDESGEAGPHTAPIDVLGELERLLDQQLVPLAPPASAGPGPRTRSLRPRLLHGLSDGRRGVLALIALFGLLTTFIGRGTLAYFTSNTVSSANVFQGGVVDIAGSFTGSTASVLPNASFAWTINGASDGYAANGATQPTPVPYGGDSNVCKTVLTGQDSGRTQRMVPGQFCVAPIDINNTNAASVDAWMRMRLYRATAAGTAANESLNSRLRFYMHEYTGGANAAANKAARDLDCTTTNFQPTWTNAPGAGTTTSIYGTSSGQIKSDTGGTTVKTRVPAVADAGVVRTSLSALGDGGKTIGSDAGVAGYIANQTLTDVGSVSGTGLKLLNGGAAAPSEANMVADPAYAGVVTGADAYNLVGNDEVSNPRLSTNTSLTNGSNSGGTNTEASLGQGASRYYCAAIFFPSNTDLTYSGAAGDNTAFGGSLTYYLVVTAAQQAGRTK